MTACVGVALSGEGETGTLWRNADMAMSRAKEQGEGRVEVYAGGDGPGGGPVLGGAGNPAGAGPDVSPAGTRAVNGAPGQPHAAAR
jgi:hypothetical protein